MVDDHEHRAAALLRVQASVASVAHSVSGTSTVIVPSCSRCGALAHLRRRGEQPGLPGQAQHPLAAGADAALAAQPRPHLAVALADERARGEHITDLREQITVAHRTEGSWTPSLRRALQRVSRSPTARCSTRWTSSSDAPSIPASVTLDMLTSSVKSSARSEPGARDPPRYAAMGDRALGHFGHQCAGPISPRPSGQRAMNAPTYDRIGLSYGQLRRADPRFETAIWRVLGDAKSVLNIGAGAGSYEPDDREVIAVEPSAVMIAQRPPDAARAIQGVAESLPLRDKSVDASMGILTIQHWDDVYQGLAELVRVTRDRVVLLTLDLDVTATMWLGRDYLPDMIEYERAMFPSIEHLEAVLPGLQVETVPVPADCTDGFCIALWARPEAYLDPRVRRASSIWHLLPDTVVERGVERLRRDLQSGDWDRRNGNLRTRPALDVGLRLVTAEPQ